MNINKKMSAAAAAVLSLILVGAGAVSANAAAGDILVPQSNGSPGAFFVYSGDSGDTVDGDPARVFDRTEQLILSASATDVNAKIMPADYINGQTYTQVYKFITKPGTEMGGTNTWLAYDTDLEGPEGGILNSNFTLEERGQGNGSGIEKVFTDGGQWIAGLAFTDNNGVTVRGLIYRTVTVQPGTGKFTIASVEYEGGAPVVVPSTQTGEIDLTVGTLGVEDGELSLEVPASAAATFSAPTLVDNKSTATGQLPQFTVNDDRVVSRPGWSLSAKVADFVNAAEATDTIAASQLSVTPKAVAAGTTSTGSVLASTFTGTAAGSLFAEAPAGHGVQSTVLAGDLVFVAPQNKGAGTYSSTMTLTVVSK